MHFALNGFLRVGLPAAFALVVEQWRGIMTFYFSKKEEIRRKTEKERRGI